MTENTDNISAALEGLRQEVDTNVRPYLLAASLASEADRKQIINGVLSVLSDCLGRFIATMEFQGYILQNPDFTRAVDEYKTDHLTALAEREKQMRDQAGVALDA